MKTSFYLGAMFVLVGLGIAKLNEEYKLAGALVMCLGAAALVIGLNGIMINFALEREFRKKRKGPFLQQK